MEQIKQTVRDYIAQSILFSSNGFPFSDEVSFLESGIVDSMNVMEIVAFTEKAFGIRVQGGEIVPGNFDSVSNVSNYVARKMAEAQSAGRER